MPRIRTFVAVDLSPDVRRQVEALQQSLAADGVTAKWAAPETLHLTLAFLGDVDDKELPTVFRAVAEAGKAVPPFAVRIAGVGAFPNLRRPKIAWAGIDEGADELIALHNAVADHLELADVYRREDRGYKPHLTLGRVKADEESSALATAIGKYADWVGGRVSVDQIKIYSSEIRRNGPEYTVMGRAELRGKKTKKNSGISLV